MRVNSLKEMALASLTDFEKAIHTAFKPERARQSDFQVLESNKWKV